MSGGLVTRESGLVVAGRDRAPGIVTRGGPLAAGGGTGGGLVTDFSSGFPDDWASLNGTGMSVWNTNTESFSELGGTVLHTTGGATRESLRWLAVNEGDPITDVEVLALHRTSYTGTSYAGGLILRGNTNDSGYLFVLRGSNRLAILRINPGGSTSFGAINVDEPYTWGANQWHWLRARIIGDVLSFKAWPVTNSEPSSFQIEETNNDLTGPGFVGPVMWSAGNYWWDYFSVGLDGASALSPS